VTLPSTLRLSNLTLKNFRCFSECTVDFHPSLTVLVAENGRGKTTILDAVGIALRVFIDTIEGGGQAQGFERSDIHLARAADGSMAPVLPTELEARGYVDGQHVH
jgi:predicted ATP-binding protein involved in virulence